MAAETAEAGCWLILVAADVFVLVAVVVAFDVILAVL